MPADKMNALHCKLPQGRSSHPKAFLTEEQPIRFTNGPMMGMTGIICSFREEDRAVVKVNIAGRELLVETDCCFLAPTHTGYPVASANQSKESAKPADGFGYPANRA